MVSGGQIINAIAGDGSAELTFATPSAKGGTLSGYIVTLSQGDTPLSLKFSRVQQGSTSTGSTTIMGTISTETANDTTIAIAGLTNGKSYTVGLVATFDGASDVIFQSAQVTPKAAKPVASSIPKVVPGDQSFQITFGTPVAKSGTTLSGYSVELQGDGGPWTLEFSSPTARTNATATPTKSITGTITSVGASTTTIEIASITNAKTYTVSVTANFNGASGATHVPVLTATKVTPTAPKK